MHLILINYEILMHLNSISYAINSSDFSQLSSFDWLCSWLIWFWLVMKSIQFFVLLAGLIQVDTQPQNIILVVTTKISVGFHFNL